jgi:hypothetical protein
VQIEIRIELSLVNARLPLAALADVTLSYDSEHILIRRCAVFEKSGEPPWASFPRLHIERNGTKSLVPLIEMSGGLKRRLLAAILVEYRTQRDAH